MAQVSDGGQASAGPRVVIIGAGFVTRVGHLPGYGAARQRLGDPERFDVDDFATAFVRPAGGRTLVLRSSWAAHIAEPTTMSSRLIGSEGGGQTDPPILFRLRDGRLSDERVPVATQQDSYQEQFKHFMRVVQGEEQPLVTEAHTLDVQRILNAAYLSAQRGEEVPVEP